MPLRIGNKVYSIDSGATWSAAAVQPANYMGGQGWYDTTLTVDPFDSNIVYAGGTFYGHAWPEVWVGTDTATGADRWIALEPTWGAPFADATHIKLAEGELSDFFKVAADLDGYRVQILEAK